MFTFKTLVQKTTTTTTKTTCEVIHCQKAPQKSSDWESLAKLSAYNFLQKILLYKKFLHECCLMQAWNSPPAIPWNFGYQGSAFALIWLAAMSYSGPSGAVPSVADQMISRLDLHFQSLPVMLQTYLWLALHPMHLHSIKLI